MVVFTEREVYVCAAGAVLRTEIQVADEDGGFWRIQDLDGLELGALMERPEGSWEHCSLPIDTGHGPFDSFDAALVARLEAIRASGGIPCDELYWQASGLPRVHGAVQLPEARPCPGAHPNRGTCSRTVALTPAPGWTATFEREGQEGAMSVPLIGWGLRCDGDIEALVADSHGFVSSADSFRGFVSITPDYGVPADLVSTRR